MVLSVRSLYAHVVCYWVTQKLPQIYSLNCATFPIPYAKWQYIFAVTSGSPSILVNLSCREFWPACIKDSLQIKNQTIKWPGSFILKHNKSFRWHLGDYEKLNFFSIWRSVRNFDFGVFLRMYSIPVKNRFIYAELTKLTLSLRGPRARRAD